MPLTGDFATLDEWERSIDRVGSTDSLTDVSRAFANESLRLTDQSFEQQRSPLGKPWARKKRPDGRAVGQGKTGRLRDTYKVKSASRFGFSIGSDVAYRRWFHGGKKGQAPRALSPGSRVPPLWGRSFQRIFHQFCRAKLRGR